MVDAGASGYRSAVRRLRGDLPHGRNAAREINVRASSATAADTPMDRAPSG
jgi:hypothetical protein